MAREEIDAYTLDWLDTAHDWPLPAQRPNAGDHAYIEANGYTFAYFSPYRPLNFIGGQFDHVLMTSAEPYHDYAFFKQALPLDRVKRWELVPANEAAWQATGWQEEPPYEP